MPRLGEERPQRWPCEECGGTGSVRCHQAEDYGVSFECDECESCHGTGVDVEALRAENERLRDALKEYGQHQSWRCEHRAHNFYIVGRDAKTDPDCPCGLDAEVRALGLAGE